MPSLTIIIPVFNKWTLTAQCLRSLARHTKETEYTVIVADNGSTDETATECSVLGRELFGKHFRHLRFNSNRNFGPACNAATRESSSELLLYLNNDTLLTENWLPPLIQTLQDNEQLTGVGPLLTYADGTVQHLGIAITPAGESVRHLYKNLPATHPLVMRRRTFPAITAAVLLLPRQRFEAVGGFYEGYRNGFEDVDLGFSLTKNGAVMSVIPESRVIHLESQTPQRNAHTLENSALLRKRWNLCDFANFVPLVRADGYEVWVDADTQMHLRVPESKCHTLLCRIRNGRNFDPVRCWDVLQEEPYWEEGYTLLGDFLEKHELWDDACRIWGHYLVIAPSLNTTIRTLRAMDKIGKPGHELYASMKKWKELIADADLYAARQALLCSILRNNGGEEFIPLYEKAAQQAAVLRSQWNGEKKEA